MGIVYAVERGEEVAQMQNPSRRVLNWRTLAFVVILGCLGCAGNMGASNGSGRPPGPPDRGPSGFDREEMEAMRARAEATRTLDVEWLWTEVSFRFDLTTEQKARCEAAFRDAWKERNGYLAYADRQEDPDWRVITKQMEMTRKRLEDLLKDTLTPEQWETLKALEKRRTERRLAWSPGF
jgi:hypothetical protein